MGSCISNEWSTSSSRNRPIIVNNQNNNNHNNNNNSNNNNNNTTSNNNLNNNNNNNDNGGRNATSEANLYNYYDNNELDEEIEGDDKINSKEKKNRIKKGNKKKGKISKNCFKNVNIFNSNNRSRNNTRSSNNHNYYDNENNINDDENGDDNNNEDGDEDDEDEDEDDDDDDDDYIRDDNNDNLSINDLVNGILNAIRTVVINNNDEEPPRIISEMQQIASNGKGWIKILLKLCDKIKLNDPLGPAIIALFLEECPLPTKDSVILLLKKMSISSNTSSSSSSSNYNNKHKERNYFVVLSCLSEKIAGPYSKYIMNNSIFDFTFSKLSQDLETTSTPTILTQYEIDKLTVVLFALISLEKFAMSTENKLKIMEHLSKCPKNPLIELSKWNNNSNYIKRQIGFCSQFLLDNAFTTVSHIYGYQQINSNDINVRLNDKDVSEYLKISPNGLEARNDTLSFESVRCTFQVDSGVWYYEATILTNGIMQIGYATKDSKFLNYNGYGIGDDEMSVAYDGCRRLIWYNAEPQPHEHRPWKEEDVIGLLLDLNNYKLIFYLNGVPLNKPHTTIFNKVRSGFFAAASFMSFQHCIFNFGREPFKFPPKIQFNCFNNFGKLSDNEKLVLPRKIKLEILRNITITENTCSLCCDNQANVTLIPCKHKDLCVDCAKRLSSCPVCRADIKSLEEHKLS